MKSKASKKVRRARAFDRRCKAAEEKRHLPSNKELILGMSFFGDDILEDAAEFAERLLLRLPEREIASAPLVPFLRRLTMSPAVDEFLELAEAIQDMESLESIDIDACLFRVQFYAACLGAPNLALQVAAEAVAIADNDRTMQDDIGLLCLQALGWLQVHDRHFSSANICRKILAQAGDRLIETVIRQHAEDSTKVASAVEAADAELDAAVPHNLGSVQPGDTQDPERRSTVVVISTVGNRDTGEGKRVVREYEKHVGKALPLVPVPDLVEVRRYLEDEFPYGREVLQPLLEELAGRSFVKLRPTILVGKPGSGKTRFAQQLLATLNVPYATYPCGGVADASMAGSARRWSTGEPSLPVDLVRRHGCASPGIVLDEVEKVASSRHNGNVLDALLGLLERESAAKWFDPYIESAVDLSHVVWLATANDIGGLSAPLRDRCRILTFPEPGPEHLEILAGRLLERLVGERGLDLRWATPLTGEELAALGDAWPGGSIRRLQRLVEGVLAVRERDRTVH